MNDTRKLQYRLVECPHCHKPIELLKNSDIEERHGITERERSRSGQWPEPWIVLGNVSLWLASEVDEAAARYRGPASCFKGVGRFLGKRRPQC